MNQTPIASDCVYLKSLSKGEDDVTSHKINAEWSSLLCHRWGMGQHLVEMASVSNNISMKALKIA